MMQEQATYTPVVKEGELTTEQATPFEWTEMVLDWSLELSIMVIVPIAVAYIVNKRRNGRNE